MPFKSETNERPWVKGERISELRKSARHNAPLEAINQIKEHIGRNLGERQEDWVVTWHSLGKLRHESPGNERFSDPRYEVEVSLPKAELESEDLLDVEIDHFEQEDFRIVVATNISEIAGGTHALTEGTVVDLFVAVREMDQSAIHYYFANTPPGGIAVHDCADAGGPATIEKFAGGFTVTFAGSQANVAPNIIADPAHPGIIITNGNGATCGPIKLGVDCNAVIQDVKYVAGVFYKTVCGIDYVVFSTTACPTPAGAPAAEFFAYNS